jgi:type IV pilus assembly protein PilC
MPVFAYKALNPVNNSVVNARLEASSVMEAKKQLREMGLLVQNLTQVKDTRKDGSSDILDALSGLFPPVPEKQVLIFTQQLASILEAGISLIEALFILEQQATHMRLRQLLGQVRQDVINGKSFSEAMSQTRIFERLFITMIKMGEQTGDLDQALRSLCELMQRNMALKKKVQKAMILPGISFVIIVGVIILMLVFVVPQFKEFFASQKEGLPFITQMLLTASEIFQNYWWGVLILTVSSAVAFNTFRLGVGKPFIDQLLLQIPVLGGLVTRIYTLRYITTLCTMISGGIILTEAMITAGETVPNLVFKQAFKSANDSLMIGGGLAQALEKEAIMPPMVTKMMSVGEQSGEFEKMLRKCIVFMDEEVESQMHAMTELIQPLMTVILGGILLFMFAAIYIPVFQIAKTG